MHVIFQSNPVHIFTSAIHAYSSKNTKDLLDVERLVLAWLVLEDVELDSLGQRSALANSHDIAFTYVLEAWGAVHRHVAVALLKTSILGHVLQIVSPHHHSALHLVRNNHGFEDAATNGDIARKRALLVHIRSRLGLLGSLEAQANALVVPHALLGALAQHAFAANEDTILLLVRLFVLICLLEVE
jgi:hypothetical protein